tara:strand:- start:532 stop:705 length:174 start_codon:yes stop_codon:yes gene_type:complete
MENTKADAEYYAEYLTQKEGMSYSVVYIDSMQEFIHMKSEPNPSYFGYTVLQTFNPT